MKINDNYWRRVFFSRLGKMTQLCNELNVPFEAGEFGITVEGRTFPLDSVLDAEPFIRKIASRRAGKLDGWF